MKRLVLSLGAVTVAIATAAPATAEIYKLSGADGTVHFTNAPTDPRYRGMGFTSGTSAGWLRLPRGDAALYAAQISDAAARHGVPERLVTAVIRVESAFNTFAVSRSGARGLMQLMPETASILGVRNSFDPQQNVDGGVRHLRAMIDRFGNNLPLALAAYNAGERAVTAYRGIPPYPETRDYVSRILRILDGESQGVDSSVIYRTVDDEGTVTYTNIPPHGHR